MDVCVCSHSSIEVDGTPLVQGLVGESGLGAQLLPLILGVRSGDTVQVICEAMISLNSLNTQ